MARLFAVAALAACTAACSLIQPTLRDVAERPWLALETEHARIWTDLSPEVAEQSARDFERHRRALLEIWGPDVNPPGKLRVIILRSKSELALFVGERYGGFFTDSPVGRYLVLGAEGSYLLGDSGADTSVQMHELAHAVTADVIKHQPRWLAEGLAKYLETTRIEADGQVVLGRADPVSLSFVLHRGTLPMNLLRLWGSDAGMGAAQLAQLYATSWAVVHFLLNQHPEPFLDYLHRIDGGEPEGTAWRAAFRDIGDNALERELWAHLTTGRGNVVRIPLPAVSAEVKRSEAAPADVHVALALLLLESPDALIKDRVGRARPEVKAALQLDPHNEMAVAINAAFERIAEPGGSATTPATTSAAPGSSPAHPCPEDIQREPPLEAGSRLSAASWVSEFGKGAMAEAAPKSERVLDETVELVVGRVAMVLGGPPLEPVGVVLREVAPGACVVNAWGTSLGVPTSPESLSSWVSADKKVAVFLVGVRVSSGGAEPQTHWVVIATDGKRAWSALRDPRGIQFVAREAKLRPQKDGLFLDVKVKGPGAIVFGFVPRSGEFVRLN